MIHLLEELGEAALDAEVLPPTPRRHAIRNPMLLHCGGAIIERESLSGIPTPRASNPWFPLPHRHLVEEVESQLTEAGFTLLGETHAVSHDGNRYFAVIEVSPEGTLFKTATAGSSASGTATTKPSRPAS